MSSDLSPEVAAVQKAVQNLANSKNSRPVMIMSAIVVWEEVTYDDEGQALFDIDYSMISESLSLAASLGLMEAGAVYMRQIILKGTAED